MNSPLLQGRAARAAIRWLLIGILAVTGHALRAYPPAPHHLIYGLLRDQFGNPIVTQAEVILETSAGAQIRTRVTPGIEPGVNYQLEVPMDAGMTSDLYKPTALRPTVPFKIKVKIGPNVYLPIEMAGDYSRLGQPSQKTLLNLTLGEDADGDGIPDAWERALIALLDGEKSLGDIRPDDDADGDGLSNLDEYISGNYAFDSKDGFSLVIAGTVNGNPVMEFTAVRGRSYTVFGSANLAEWTEAPFRIEGTDTPVASRYHAASTRRVRIESVVPDGQNLLFYKLLVQ